MERERKEDQPLMLTEQTFPIIEQITAGMPGGFFIYHADEKEELIYANRALIHLYGCETLKEFLAHTGGTFPGMIHPEDRQATADSIREQIAVSCDNLDYVEYRIVRKDGSVRWVDDYGHFVHTKAFGDVFYVFLVDATEKYLRQLIDEKYAQLGKERRDALERLEHETTALRIVHESLRSGMWTVEFNRAGEMTSVLWSNKFREMLGYRTEADFPNRLESWSDLLHPEDRERVLREYYGTIEDYTGQKVCDVEYRLLTRDRGYRWFRTTGKLSRRRDGTPITYVGMFVDITSRKEKDRKLIEQRHLLETALEEAQQASRAKTVFLNNMSHDIRTPMNAIIGFTTLATNHTDNPELLLDYLGKILASSQHLLSLINDVLDMSRIESGTVSITEAECSLADIFRDLWTIVQADVQTRELDFSADFGGVIHKQVVCDRLRISQALLNVVSNAIKFTPPGGRIRLMVRETPEATGESSSYRIEIRDSGIGMSPAFLQRVFEPFERERTSTVSGIQGTGLGMTITKNLIDLMGGQIQVESEAGKGTCVTISLRLRVCPDPIPLDTEPFAQPGRLGELVPEESFGGKRILLVEDNELNREIAVTILEEMGLEIDLATDGAVAVEKVMASAGDPYRLILMDIQMPVLDGYGATRAIRALPDPAMSKVPILAMTANALEEDRQRAKEAGMDGHLGKPIEIDRLLAALRKYLG